MKEFTIKLENREGLHARPASRLVELCHNFKSSTLISFAGIKANAKNITEVLSLGVEDGDLIDIRVDGSDEDELYGQLTNFFSSKIKDLKNY